MSLVKVALSLALCSAFSAFGIAPARPTSAQDWTAIDVGSSATLRDFEQRGNGRYLVGDSGFVARSDLSYASWTREDVGTSEDLLSVIRPFFGNETWASGRDGVVRVRTSDGVWHPRDVPDSTQTFYLVERVGADAGVLAAGSGGDIWKSTDGGSSWDPNGSVTAPLNGGLGSFDSSNEDFLVGDGGLILRSTDDGANWIPLPSGTTENLYAIEQVPPNADGFVVVGANGTILTTSNGGASWSQHNSGTTETLRAISFSGGVGYLAVGDNGTALRSGPSANSWCALQTGTTTDLHAAMLLTAQHLLVAGDDGLLLRTTTSGGSCTPVETASDPDAPAAPPAGYALSAIWPNPARTTATITYRVDHPQHVTVDIFDINGRRQSRAYSGHATAGVAVPVTLNLRASAPGVYVVRVRGADFVESRQVVVL